MRKELKERLIKLAEQYETPAFILNDPIQIPHRYVEKADVEIVALITSWVATGNRKAIIKSMDQIDCKLFRKVPYKYIMDEEWKQYEGNKKSFYRYYSYHDFFSLCLTLHHIYLESDCLEDYLYTNYSGLSPLQCIQSTFGHINGMPDITSSSEAKKLCMFLRWMVRSNSPVDLGIWSKFNSASLVIPLDTHVHRIATDLGITNKRKCIQTAHRITEALREIWPDDPVKGDFALFGYGVNESIADRAFSNSKNINDL